MAAQLASFVGKNILKENVRNKFGQEDPYFERVPASRLGRAFGKKTQKRRKAIPPGLSQNDAKILNRVKRRAYRLDYALFSLCGLRFGWGSVIGLIPFVGDGLDGALAMMVARDCQNIDGGLPSHIYSRMLLNIVFDFVIGLVPFVGDLADAAYKCNTRNAILLERYLREKEAKAEGKRAKREPGAQSNQRPIDLSIPEEFDRYDDDMDPDPPGYTQDPVSEAVSQGHIDHSQGSARQDPTHRSSSNQRDKSRSDGRKKKQEDLEAGIGGRH